MYMAQMYCYGWDYQCVGITGIRGCIGCVYVGAAGLYAVHIPPQTLNKQFVGAAAFAGFVVRGPDWNMGKKGQLYVFVNGRNRIEADDEAQAIRSMLNKPVTKVYRIMRHLGANSGGVDADSVSVLVQRTAIGLNMTYKHVPDNQWLRGGREKSGIYDQQYEDTFGWATIPTDAVNGWHGVDNTTCRVVKIN